MELFFQPMTSQAENEIFDKWFFVSFELNWTLKTLEDEPL